MIHLGLTPEQKVARIADYCRQHDIQKTVILSPAKFALACDLPNTEQVEWAEIILYRFFYRLLQEIDGRTLVVVNECLRTQNRYDLTYNCIRHYLNQAGHQLVFQWLPLIDDLQDFMILFDFDTRSRWKRERFDSDLLAECTLEVSPHAPRLQALPVATDAKTQAAYAANKAKLLSELGNRDPHTLPRNLYLMSGRSKLPHVEPGRWYVGRNNRFKLAQAQTYKEVTYPNAPYTVFELPHNFIDFADFMSLSGQEEVPVLVADLKVDHWYFERYNQWARRIEDGYSSLQPR